MTEQQETFEDSVELVVVHEFGTYHRGDVITDPMLVEQILGGEHELHVVKKFRKTP